MTPLEVHAAMVFTISHQVGNAVGYFFPPLLVRNSDNLEDIAKDLNRVYIGLAVSSVLSLLLTVACEYSHKKSPRFDVSMQCPW